MVTVPGLYTLTEGPTSDPSSIQIVGPGVDRSLDPTGTNDTQLAPGEYTLRFRNLSSHAQHFTLIVRLAAEPDGDRPGQRRGARPRTVVAADLVPGSGRPSAPFGAHAHGPIAVTFLAITIAVAHGDSGSRARRAPPARTRFRWDGTDPPRIPGSRRFLPRPDDGLVGRPTDSTPYTESPTGWPSPGAGPSAIGAVHQGPPRVAIPSRSIGPRSEWPTLSTWCAVMSRRSALPRQTWCSPACDGESKEGDGSRPWAIRQAVAIGSWIMSWSDGDDLPDSAVAQVHPRPRTLATGASARMCPGRRARRLAEWKGSLDPARAVAAGGHPFRGRDRPVLLACQALAEAAKGIEAGRVEPRRRGLAARSTSGRERSRSPGAGSRWWLGHSSIDHAPSDPAGCHDHENRTEQPVTRVAGRAGWPGFPGGRGPAPPGDLRRRPDGRAGGWSERDPRTGRQPGQPPVPTPIGRCHDVGEKFLGFELIDVLGRGAFGTVYLARQECLADRPVVLKITPSLDAEPKLLARLQHTNIVPIYSVHRVESSQIVCMPFLGTTTLENVCTSLRTQGTLPETGLGLISSLIDYRTGKRLPSTRHADGAADREASCVPTVHGEGMPADEQRSPCTRTLKYLEGLTYVQAVLWVGSRLASGLAHAHERSILHLDLKPANILLTDDGEPMLLDFNLSIDLKNRPPTRGGRWDRPLHVARAARGVSRRDRGRSTGGATSIRWGSSSSSC